MQQQPFKASKTSMRVYNPIRATIDTIVHPKDATKEHIPLSIGKIFAISQPTTLTSFGKVTPLYSETCCPMKLSNKLCIR